MRRKSQTPCLRALRLLLAAVPLVLGSGCGDSASENNTHGDAGPPAICGNGQVEQGEECDDGAANSDSQPDACRTDCSAARCGDGVLDTAEECDEGYDNSDAVPDACRTDCTAFRCGDGVLDTAEECDDGTANSDTLPDACRLGCALPGCGDGVVDSRQLCLRFGSFLYAEDQVQPVDLDQDGLGDFVTDPAWTVGLVFQGADLAFTPRPYTLLTEAGSVVAGDFDGDGDVDVARGGLVAENTAGPGAPPDFRIGLAYPDSMDADLMRAALVLPATSGPVDRYLITVYCEGAEVAPLDATGIKGASLHQVSWDFIGSRITKVLALDDLTGEGVAEAVVCYRQHGDDCRLLKTVQGPGGLELVVSALPGINRLALAPLPGHPQGLIGCTNDVSSVNPLLTYLEWNGVQETLEPIAVPAELAVIHSVKCLGLFTRRGAGEHPDILVAADWGNQHPTLYTWDAVNTQYDPVPLTLGMTATEFLLQRAELTDFDGDGYTDVVYEYRLEPTHEESLGVAFGGAAGFTYQDLLSQPITWFDVAPVDGDAFPDLVISPWSDLPQPGLLYVTGGAVLGAPTLLPGPRVGFVRFDDLDGDGWQDLLLVSQEEILGSVMNDQGALRAPDRLVGPAGPTDHLLQPSPSLAGDFTGDGLADIAVVDGLRLLVFSEYAPGGFAVVHETALVTPLAGLVAADLDGDGRPDLIGVTSTDFGEEQTQFRVLFNSASTPGTFPTQQVYETDYPLLWLDGADLDGDGRTDLVVSNGLAGIVSVLLNQGGSPPAFQPAGVYLTDGIVFQVTAVDLDQDGFRDIVATLPLDGNPVVLWGHGDGSFSEAEPIPNLSGTLRVVVADVDDDGDRDAALIRHDVASSQGAFFEHTP